MISLVVEVGLTREGRRGRLFNPDATERGGLRAFGEERHTRPNKVAMTHIDGLWGFFSYLPYRSPL